MNHSVNPLKKKPDTTAWIMRIVIGGAIAFAALNHFQPNALESIQQKFESLRGGSSSSSSDSEASDTSATADASSSPDAEAGARASPVVADAKVAPVEPTAPVAPAPAGVDPNDTSSEFVKVEPPTVTEAPKPAPATAPPPPKPVAPKVVATPKPAPVNPAPRDDYSPPTRHVPSASATTPTVTTVSVAARPGSGSYANIAKFMGTRNFNVNVREGQRIYARLLPGKGRAQMRIHAPDGTSMTGQSAGQEWDVQAPVSGTYIVRVFTGGTMTYAGQVHITVN